MVVYTETSQCGLCSNITVLSMLKNPSVVHAQRYHLMGFVRPNFTLMQMFLFYFILFVSISNTLYQHFLTVSDILSHGNKTMLRQNSPLIHQLQWVSISRGWPLTTYCHWTEDLTIHTGQLLPQPTLCKLPT
jgi:hypothetical protein